MHIGPGPPLSGHRRPQQGPLQSQDNSFPDSIFIAEVDTAGHNSPSQGHHHDPGAPLPVNPPLHSLKEPIGLLMGKPPRVALGGNKFCEPE